MVVFSFAFLGGYVYSVFDFLLVLVLSYGSMGESGLNSLI